MKPIVVSLPIRIVSVANLREHHRPKARRTADHRGTVKLALWARCAELRAMLAHGYDNAPRGTFPWRAKDAALVRVVLTRQGMQRLDGDNLQSACKAARDGIADALGVDDADARVVWEYDQETTGRARTYGLRIAVTLRVQHLGPKALEEARVRGKARRLDEDDDGTAGGNPLAPEGLFDAHEGVFDAHTPPPTVGAFPCPSGRERKQRASKRNRNSGGP
jgi:hypothetical protein